MFFQKSLHFIAHLFINISYDNLKLLILNVFSWNFKIVIAVVDRLFSQTNQIDAWHISKRNKSFSWQLHWAAAVPKYLVHKFCSKLLALKVSNKHEGANKFVFSFDFFWLWVYNAILRTQKWQICRIKKNFLDLPIFRKKIMLNDKFA